MSKKSTAFDLIGLPEVAEICGITYPVVRRWQREGQLPKPFNAFGHPKWKRPVIERWYREDVAGDDETTETPNPQRQRK